MTTKDQAIASLIQFAEQRETLALATRAKAAKLITHAQGLEAHARHLRRIAATKPPSQRPEDEAPDHPAD